MMAIDIAYESYTKSIRSAQQMGEVLTFKKEADSIRLSLPDRFKLALSSGYVVVDADDSNLDGREDINQIFKTKMSTIIKQVFTQFEKAAVNIPRDDIIKSILNWEGGALPEAYFDLGLVDRNNNILTTGPVAHPILLYLKKQNQLLGKDLLSEFEAPQYGWPERAIRLTVATLYRNGSLEISPENESTFISNRIFRNSRITLGAVITRKEREKAKEILSELFGESTGVTPEQIAESIDSVIRKWNNDFIQTMTTNGVYSLPYVEDIKNLQSIFNNILNKNSDSLKIKELLDENNLNILYSKLNGVKKVIDFVDSSKFKDYLRMLEFNKVLNEIKGYSDVDQDITDFNILSSSNEIIAKWPSLYDKYVHLQDKYNKNYNENHKELQVKIDANLKELDEWITQLGIDRDLYNSEISDLETISCKDDVEINYAKPEYRCNKCNRNLQTIKLYLGTIDNRFNDLRSDILNDLKDEKIELFDEKYETNIEVKSKLDMSKSIREVTDYVEYWINKNKKIDIKIRGNVEDKN